jgi:hypothetical protein
MALVKDSTKSTRGLEMEPANSHDLDVLLERVGLNPTQQDRDRLGPLFEAYMGRLTKLHAADLDEEVAGIFLPHEDLPRNGAS